MKIVGIIALVFGMTMGSTVFANDHESGGGTTGTPGECWMEMDHGGAYEVCGTVFPGGTDDHEPANGR